MVVGSAFELIVQSAKILSPDIIEAEKLRRARTKIWRYFPDSGPLRRDLYPQHMQFFAAGGVHTPFATCPASCSCEKTCSDLEKCPSVCRGLPHRERLFLAANRVGKTEAGAYEMVLHLTGLYPAWWTGKRFDRAIKAWSCGDTGKTVREIGQAKLLGPIGEFGTGFIPGDLIQRVTTKQGISDAVDTIYVRHVSGRSSVVVLKSYDQKRISFQGSEQDFIVLDEEAPMDITTECLLRTMTTGGHICHTFTPLQGLSEVVLSFLPGGLPSTSDPA
jgi:phage terminase large subunit-like protein